MGAAEGSQRASSCLPYLVPVLQIKQVHDSPGWVWKSGAVPTCARMAVAAPAVDHPRAAQNAG